MVKYTEQGPGDGDASSEITFRGGEGVCHRGRFQEEKGQEHKDLGEDPSVMVEGIDTKGIECGDEDQEGGEPMPKREGQMDPKFVMDVLGRMMLLHNVIDVRDGGTNEESQEEGDDISTVTPDIDVAGIEDDEERQTPIDSIDDDLFAAIEELVDDSPE